MENRTAPIAEEIGDKDNFARVMPFLDHSKILAEIRQLRNQLSLKRLVPYESYDDWFDRVTSTKVPAKVPAFIWRIYVINCPNILAKYGRQDISYHTLWKAAVCGKVTDSDCHSEYVEIIYPDLKPGLVPKLALIFSPDSTIKEVVQAFKARRGIVQQYLQMEVGKGVAVPDLAKSNVTLEKLKGERALYLLHKFEKYSYVKIAYKQGIIRKTPEWEAQASYRLTERMRAKEVIRSKIESYDRRVTNSLRLIP